MHAPILGAAALALLALAPARPTDTEPAAAARQAESAAVLPPPAQPIAIPGDAGSLDRLLVDLAASAGVHLVFDAEAREALAARRVAPEPAADVPPDEAWATLEALLFVNDVALYELRASAPRLLLVARRDANPQRRAGLPHRVVAQEDLPRYAAHHALRIQSALVFEALDARQAANALRGLTQDQELELIAPDARGLVIRGGGSRVAAMAELLHSMDQRALALPPAPAREGD